MIELQAVKNPISVRKKEEKRQEESLWRGRKVQLATVGGLILICTLIYMYQNSLSSPSSPKVSFQTSIPHAPKLEPTQSGPSNQTTSSEYSIQSPQQKIQSTENQNFTETNVPRDFQNQAPLLQTAESQSSTKTNSQREKDFGIGCVNVEKLQLESDILHFGSNRNNPLKSSSEAEKSLKKYSDGVERIAENLEQIIKAKNVPFGELQNLGTRVAENAQEILKADCNWAIDQAKKIEKSYFKEFAIFRRFREWLGRPSPFYDRYLDHVWIAVQSCEKTKDVIRDELMNPCLCFPIKEALRWDAYDSDLVTHLRIDPKAKKYANKIFKICFPNEV